MRTNDPSLQLQGAALLPFGFIHVTGIPPFFECGEQSSVGRVIRPHKKHAGTYTICPTYTVIVTLNGEVWMAHAEDPTLEFGVIMGELCPNGKSDFDPISSGSGFLDYQVTARRNDPLDRYGGQIPSEPAFA